MLFDLILSYVILYHFLHLISYHLFYRIIFVFYFIYRISYFPLLCLIYHI